MNTTIEFVLDRETKNTVRYQEEADPASIGTLYVQKLALPKPYPQRLSVTIQAS